MKILKLLLMFLCTSDQCIDQDYYTFPGLIHEVFRNNASRKDIEEFKSDLNYTEIPDSYNIIDVFNAPNSSGGYYGLRIRGWFVAPVNGNHTFYSSCSDICELYISNNIRPNNKVLIINQTNQSINQSYYHHSSGLIYLNAGNKYYIEALMANFDLNDYLSIAVLTSPTSNPVFQPISMNMLSGIRIEKCNQSDVNAKYETCIFESSNFGICTCSYGQKVTKNQIVCQDGNEVVEEFVFKNFEIPLLQNTIVAVMKTLYREFTISFEFYPISYSDYWASAKSVVGLRAGADKSPAIFLQPSKSGACVAQSINNVITNFNCNKSFPLKQWSSIKISQKLVNLDYLHYIYINKSVVYSAVNIKPVVLSNVKVYAAEPWSFAQNGFIRNLSIINSPITQFFHVSPGLLREVYCNISKSNYNIDALRNNPKYPLTPDSYEIIDMFDAPQNIADFYGQRIRGWFFAPQTGNYNFYSSCDNYCELYISNDSDPNNKKRIIYQKDYTSYKEFNKYPSQNSSNLFLIKNIKYYIEALMTEGNGGDQLSIGVQIQELSNLTLIIPNSFLSPIRIEFCITGYCQQSVHEQCIFENGTYGICTCKFGQKIRENQIICQDSNEEVQESVFMEVEVPLVRNTYVATLKTLYKQYTVSFQVKPTSFYSNSYYMNVIHLTTGGGGDSISGVWFGLNQQGILHISSTINNTIDKYFDTKFLFPLLQWTSIKLKQELLDGLYKYLIVINGTVVFSSTNINPAELSNVKVYVASPWYPAQSGSIRNLIIVNTPDYSPGLVREVYYNLTSDSVFILNSNFLLNPNLFEFTEFFDTFKNPKNNYVQRIWGWFLAHRHGYYTFYSSCNKTCALYLSNNTEPENKKLIIQHLVNPNCSLFCNHSSEMVYLYGNKKYYIESLMSGDVSFGYITVGVNSPGSIIGSINYLLKNMLSPLRIEMCNSANCARSIYEKCILKNGVYAICTCTKGQKIKNNQIVCHDELETITDFIYMETEIPLMKDTYVATLKTLNKEYTISFDVKPTVFYDNMANVIYLSAHGSHVSDGYKNFSIWFSPFSKGSLDIWFSINNSISSTFYTKQLLLLKWTSVRILQVFLDDCYKYSVFLNGVLFFSTINIAPFVLTNVTVYAAHTWNEAQSGFIRNLIISSQGEWSKWSDWSTCNASNSIGVMNRSRLCKAPNKLELCFGNSTEFAHCDEKCPGLETVLLSNEMLLMKNKTVAALIKVYEEYLVSFEVKPTSYIFNWSSVIHLTNLNNTGYGDWNPAVFFQGSQGMMYIYSAINGESNYSFFTSPIPLMQWTTVKISQQFIDGDFVYSISLNGSVIHSVVNNKTVVIPNVKVYAGNPWYEPQPGFLRNVVVISGLLGISHQWSDWSSCNASCGYGWKNRTQKYCMTDYLKEELSGKIELSKCFSNNTCEGEWSKWSDWSTCNASNSIGIMNRSRLCTTPNKLEQCFGNSTEFAHCDEKCPEISHQWSDWSSCNASCGYGWKNRIQKYCMTDYLKEELSGKIELSKCFSNNTCEVNWSQWTNWSPCNYSLGIGFTKRHRECNSTNAFEWCSGKTKEKSDCFNNNTWGEWSHWGECSKTCGFGYKSSCFRTSLSEGLNERIRVKRCLNIKCPVDGEWNQWAESEQSSAVCGSYLIKRKRYCNNPSPKDGGHECWGLSNDLQYWEGDTVCPVHGNWTIWSSWTLCSQPCQGGVQLRLRNCTNPVPKYGGLLCNGIDKEHKICNSNKCKKVSVNFGLIFMEEEYLNMYSDPANGPSTELSIRIKTAITNLYIKYNKSVNYELELHSMKDGRGDI